MPNLRHELQVFLVASPHTRHATRGSDSAIAIRLAMRARIFCRRWGGESRRVEVWCDRRAEYVGDPGCLLKHSAEYGAETREVRRDVMR